MKVPYLIRSEREATASLFCRSCPTKRQISDRRVTRENLVANRIAISSSLESDLNAAFRAEDEYVANFLSDGASSRRLWLIGNRKEPPTPRGKLITLGHSGHHSLNGYLVTPRGNVRGAIAFAHDIFGITEEVMRQCDNLAEEGYSVLAPDLFWLQTEKWQSRRTAADVRKSLDLAKTSLLKDQISETVNTMQIAIDILGLAGKIDIHALGYDFGGSIAWLAADFCYGLTSTICFYGPHIKVMDTGHLQCPALLHLSERDTRLPLEWVRNFSRRRTDVSISTYDAGPGFTSDRSATRDERSASRASKRTADWLNGGYRQFLNSLSDEDLAQKLQSHFFQPTMKDWPIGPNALRILDRSSSESFIENWLNEHTDIHRSRRKAVSDALSQRWWKVTTLNVAMLGNACQREIFPDLKSTSQLKDSKAKIEQWLHQRYPQIDRGNLELLAQQIDHDFWRSLTA